MDDKMTLETTRVLIVDDDPDIRRMLAALFELEGYTVSEARDGMEALRAFKQNRPDLVILDIGMPRLSGFEVMDRFGSFTGFDDKVPVIVLSAFSEDDQIDEGYRRGATVYMTKPTQIPNLIEVAARLCGKQEMST